VRTRTVFSALLVAVALAGCGGDEREAEAPRGSSLSVTVLPEGPGGPEEIRTTVCPADPGCDAPLAPTSPSTACTEIYGGPATATVTGERNGREVDAEFSLSNGCEIARWEDASALLGDPPRMQQSPYQAPPP